MWTHTSNSFWESVYDFWLGEIIHQGMSHGSCWPCFVFALVEMLPCSCIYFLISYSWVCAVPPTFPHPGEYGPSYLFIYKIPWVLSLNKEIFLSGVKLLGMLEIKQP